VNQPLRERLRLWTQRILRYLLGVTFIYASLDKIAHPDQFALAVYNYRLLPDALVNGVALILPWVELLTGASLLLGFFELPALFIVNGLMLIFIGAVSFNLARGMNINCGCFSTDPAAKGDLAFVLLRDLVLLAMGFLALILYPRRGSSPKHAP
jgi:uncharacterized membrane protein YphA (DoxX/SURF4 family)